MDNLLALPNGTELGGDYRISHVLGAGGFGITYLAEETPLHRKVAIKEYFPADFAHREGTTLVRSKSTSLDEDYQWGLDRFIEEAQALARFDHGNIVRVYRYFRQNNTGYMVLQHEEGRSFKTWLDQLKRPPSQAELDAIAAPLLEALELIHARDFLHRDLAPDNIIIRQDGSPVLIDFGSARREVARHSRTVSVLVKPGYSPFEQYAQTGKQQGPWTDIYALAATLYLAVTGKRPTDAPTRVSADDYVPVDRFARGRYRPGFLAAIDRGLALKVEGRPQSIAAWRAELLPAGMPAPKPAASSSLPVARTRKLEGEVPLPQGLPKRKPKNAPPPVLAVAKAKAAKAPKAKPAGEGLLQAGAKLGAEVGAFAADAAKRSRRSLMSLLAKARPHAESEANAPTPGKAKAAKSGQPDITEPPADDSVTEARKPLPAPRAGWFKGAFQRRAKAAPAAIAAAFEQAQRPPKQPWRLPQLPLPSAKGVARRSRGLLLKGGVVVGIVSAMVLAERWLLPDRPALQSTPVNSATDVSLVRSQRQERGAVTAMAVSGDGRILASAGASGNVYLWSAETGEILRAIPAKGGEVNSLSITGDTIAAGLSNGAVLVWQLATGEPVESFQKREGPIWAVAFTDSERHLAAAGQDRRIRLLDTRGAVRAVFSEHGKAVLALAYAPGQRLIATGSSDKTVRLWDERRKRLLRTYEGHTDDVRAVAISPDGSVIASGSYDKTIMLWPAGANERLGELAGHADRVVALAFSPSGELLASASEDGTVKLWDWAESKLLHTYEGHSQAVRSVVFMPDGQHLVSAGDDRTIRIWNSRIAGYR